MVGHCVQVVHRIYCNSKPDRKCEAEPKLRSEVLHPNPNSLLFSEANSRRSRSFMGKLTKVDSLLVLRASEKRFRSGQEEESKKNQTGFYKLH